MKKSFSWSKPDIPNLIGRKVVDLSLIEKGNTGIPKDFQIDFDEVNHHILNKGEKRKITLVYYGREYEAYIESLGRNDSKNSSYRIHRIENDLREIFKRKFSESYKYLQFAYKEKLDQNMKKIFVKLPKELEEYVYFFATGKPYRYEITFTSKFLEIDTVYQEAINEYSEAYTTASTPTYTESNKIVFNRNPAVAFKSLEAAHFRCEIDAAHETFISRSNNQNYVEAHHLIPIAYQKLFEKSVDQTSNIISLCPTCHRKLHHGLAEEVKDMLKELYDQRIENLKNDNLLINEKTLFNMY